MAAELARYFLPRPAMFVQPQTLLAWVSTSVRAEGAWVLAEGAANPLAGMWPILLMIGVFYFLVLRPMKKQEDQRKQRLSEIKRGDKVVLTGGLLGRVSRVDDDIAVIEIAEKVKVRVLKKDIADFEENALKKDDKKGDKKDEAKKDEAKKDEAKPKDDDDDNTDDDKSSRKAG
jgi:preprotein translocase subunit YajC